MPILTKDIIPSLPVGKVLHHKTQNNADGTPLRARINGKMQERKRTGIWRLPMKHGFRDCFDINDQNAGEWFTDVDEAILWRLGYSIEKDAVGVDGFWVFDHRTNRVVSNHIQGYEVAISWAINNLTVDFGKQRRYDSQGKESK